jgi:NADH-quinone oxidoreductase subunit C
MADEERGTPPPSEPAPGSEQTQASVDDAVNRANLPPEERVEPTHPDPDTSFRGRGASGHKASTEAAPAEASDLAAQAAARRAARETEAATVAVRDPEAEPVTRVFREVLPGVQFSARLTANEVNLDVPRESLLELMRAAKEHPSLRFDFLRCVSGIDHQQDGLACVYHLFSLAHGHSVQVSVAIPLEDPVVPAMTQVWKGANWLERETAEMFGIVFEGHPDPRNLLLDDDVRIHPLLKAHPLAPIEVLQGVEDDAGFDF